MKELFRKEAVDSFKKKFFTDKRLSRISFSTLVMSALLIVGLKLFSVWFFNGTVVNSIDVGGVLYPSAGMEKVYALGKGTISNVNVRPGDEVKMGEVIAVIPDDDILEALYYDVRYGDEIFDEELATDGESQADKYDKYIGNNRSEYAQNSFVRSVRDGTVISVAQKGSYVEKGDVIALIATDDTMFDRDRIIVFLPTEKKGNIHEGDSVQISPNYAKREKYGYILGHIHNIGTDIISKKDALEQYNFYNIPNMLDEDTTYIIVTIVLEENEDMESGLAWSQASSGSIAPELGTYCKCSIITDEQTPFKWLFGGEE